MSAAGQGFQGIFTLAKWRRVWALSGESLFQRPAQAKAVFAYAKVQHVGLLFKIIDHRAVVQDGRGIDAQFGEEMLHPRLAAAGGDGKAPAVFHDPFRRSAVFR